MLYRQFNNFRDLNLHSFHLYNVPDKYKKTKSRNLEEPLIAISYINHNMGLNLIIIGDKYEDEVKDKIIITNEDNFENIDFQPLKINLNYEDILKHEYYEDIELVKTRSITKIDKFRHADYPDDIEVLIPLENKRIEQVWIRLKKVIDENTYIGILLHDSSEVSCLKKDTKVKIIYYKEPKKDYLILDSIIE
ncbi:MAG TPA: hypothetical protein DCE23_03365 [Firmicutes bacterium]|nr:hypothetical protein [Bacillota bacterium]